MSEPYRQVTVRSRAEWRRWLEQHHATTPGIWLVRFKKGAGPHVPYDDVVEEAVAFGWVDSRPKAIDDKQSALLVTPRKKGSAWSSKNKERVARLEAAGLMTPAGKAAVQRARRDGSWGALDQVETLSEPPDLQAALDQNHSAREHWDAFPRSTRRAILEWIGNAKRPEIRSRRVDETVAQAARNIRANQWRQPGDRSSATQWLLRLRGDAEPSHRARAVAGRDVHAQAHEQVPGRPALGSSRVPSGRGRPVSNVG